MQFAFPSPVTSHKNHLKNNVIEMCVNERIICAFVCVTEKDNNSLLLFTVLYNTQDTNCTDIIRRHPTQNAMKSYVN
jgi:hypothetical protein